MPSVPKGFSGAAGGKFGMGVRNLPQVIASIERAGMKFEKNIKMHANRILIMLISESHRLIKNGYYQQAYQEGTLFRGIGGEVSSTATRVDIDFGVEVEYAIYVHEGTIYMEERAFLMDAIMNKKKEIMREMKQAFRLTGH